MRPHADAEQDRAAELTPAGLPRSPWRVAQIDVLPGFRLRVRFNDGLEGTVDLAVFIDSATVGVFAALRDENLFRQVRVELGAVTWPGNLDLAPDAMHRAIRAHGTWVVE